MRTLLPFQSMENGFRVHILLFQFFCIINHLFRAEFIHENATNFSKKHELLEKPKMMIYYYEF